MRSLFIAFVLVAAALAANAQTSPAAAPATTAPTIVFVNADTLLSNYDYYKAEKAKMVTLSQKAQAEINAKGDAFQKKVAAYQKSASALTPAQKTATEKKLAAEQQGLQNLSQNTGKQLQDIEASENATLYERINTYLKTYTKAKGYKIVLTYSKSSPSMLYGDDSLDVTKEVLAGLNAEYKAGQK
ncbi:MAG: OmpH family outer membrane protein [Sphingobacteriales bacterium]